MGVVRVGKAEAGRGSEHGDKLFVVRDVLV